MNIWIDLPINKNLEPAFSDFQFSGLIPQLINRVKIDTTFFQEYRITKVTVGDQCVYERETLTEVVKVR